MAQHKQTWGEWLGIDEASRAAAKSKKKAEKKAMEDKAVEELRERMLNTEEGRLCAKQLAETGEFGRGGSEADAVTDAFLRRWLVARDWHVDVTFKLLVNHGGWRDHVFGARGYIAEADVAAPLAADTIFLQGRDREGRALIIVKVANHDSRSRDLKQMRTFSTFIMEAMVALCDRERNPGCRLASMFDLTGCRYNNLDAAVMRGILGILSTHYVERLSVLYFYNPPALFHGLWNASKHLLPDVTARKIKMVAAGDAAELRAWLPDDVLPREYGGGGDLLPIAEACRRFRLGPFDGLIDPATPVPAPPHDAEVAAGSAAAAARSSGDGAAADGDVVVEDEAEAAAAAGGKAAPAGAAAAAAEAAGVAA